MRDNESYLFRICIIPTSLVSVSSGVCFTTHSRDVWSTLRKTTRNRLQFDIKVRENRRQKRAIFFAKLLKSELKSDVASFTTHVQTCFATNQVTGCQNVATESRE